MIIHEKNTSNEYFLDEDTKFTIPTFFQSIDYG